MNRGQVVYDVIEIQNPSNKKQKITVSVLSNKMSDDDIPKMIDRNFCRPISSLEKLFYDTNNALRILSNSFQVEMKGKLKDNEIKNIVVNIDTQRKSLLEQTEVANRYLLSIGNKMANKHPSNFKGGYTINLNLDSNAQANFYDKLYADKTGDGLTTKTLLKRVYDVVNFDLTQLSIFWRDGDFNTNASAFKETFYQTVECATKPISKILEKNEACK